jgi:hypothetical protein
MAHEFYEILGLKRDAGTDDGEPISLELIDPVN